MTRNPKPLFPLFVLMLALGLNGCTWVTHQWQILRFEPQLEAADRALGARDFALAATSYEALLDRYPASEQRDALRYRQAVALYMLGSRHDAQTAFQMYLLEFPEGKFAENAHDYLDKIATLNDQRGAVGEQVLEAAAKDVAKLQQLQEQYPHNTDVLIALGNLQYELGQYDEAVKHYYRATQIDAALLERSLIQDRMMLNEQGEPVPVTPEMQERIRKERQPLVVFSTYQYIKRDRGGEGGGDLRFVSVTGQVRNQSLRVLQDVTVSVDFLDLNNNILDTQTVRIGPMTPGQIRAFRVQSDNYDNLYNVNRVEFTPNWRG